MLRRSQSVKNYLLYRVENIWRKNQTKLLINVKNFLLSSFFFYFNALVGILRWTLPSFLLHAQFFQIGGWSQVDQVDSSFAAFALNFLFRCWLNVRAFFLFRFKIYFVLMSFCDHKLNMFSSSFCSWLLWNNDSFCL